LRNSERALESALKRECFNDSSAEARILETAHDIRANLSPIIGYSEIFKDEFYGPLGNDKYRDSAKTIHVATTRLFEICNSILNADTIIASEENTQEGKESVDAAKTIGEIINLFKDVAIRRNIELTSKISPDFPILKLPSQHLYRAISNLVSNAMKFTPSGGKVSIEVNVDDYDDAYIMVIRNTGPGIPADQIMRLLKPYQTEESLYGEDGTGLGLPIVNKLMQEMGGTFEIKSNGTTTITLKFPKNST